MTLDELKAAWSAHGARLEQSFAIDDAALRDVVLRRVRRTLTPFVLTRVLETVLAVLALAAAGPLLVAHGSEPRYLLVAGAVALFAALVAALSAQLAVRGARLDLAGPVLAIQTGLERLRRLEYRALKWTLLGGVLVWLPVALVGFEAITGIAVIARVDVAWLFANLGFGLLVLIAGHVLSRRHVERDDLSPRARKLIDAVTGRGVRVASERLAELARFAKG